MKNTPQKILTLLSQVKTFGTFGEKYQVVAPIRQLHHGDWLMKIKILHSGEIMPYRYSEILYDPIASTAEITHFPL